MANTALQDAIFLWFGYYPKQGPAIFAIIMFFLVGIANMAVTFRTKAWFMIVIPLTAALEIGGYAARVLCLHHPGLAAYATMQGLIIISPIFLALADYSAVGKLMQRGNINVCCIKARWVGKLFFASDIFCLLIQVIGAGQSAKLDAKSQQSAKNFLLAGLALQLVFFTMFTVMTVWVHTKLKGVQQYKPAFCILYVTIVLLYIRNFYRLDEFLTGFRSGTAIVEAYLYCFDFLLIWLCFFLLTVWHFGFYVQSPAPAPAAIASAEEQASIVQIRAYGSADRGPRGAVRSVNTEPPNKQQMKDVQLV